MDTRFLWLDDAWRLSPQGGQSKGEALINLEDVSSIAFQDQGSHDFDATIIMREGTVSKLRTSDAARRVHQHVTTLAHHLPPPEPASREGDQR